MWLTIIFTVINISLGVVFSVFGTVTTLPNVLGFDIDSALITGIQYFNQIATVFWPLKLELLGVLSIFAYIGIKKIIIITMGSRSPVKDN